MSACARHENANNSSVEVDEEPQNKFEPEESAPVIDPVWIRAGEIALSLDDRLLAAQILISGIDGRGSLPPHMKTLLIESPVGGVMLFKYNLDTDNDSIRALISETVSLIKNESGIPPFIAVDHEGGTVSRFRQDVAVLPAASFYWELFLAKGRQEALAKIEEDSLKTAGEIFDLGINLNFAPVAEYLNEDNRNFLESRAYGHDPSFAAEAAAAFIRGMEQAGVLCVVKHFPGSAGPDPHYSPSILNGDRAALNSLVYPFAALIKNGARAVIVAHTAVPEIDSEIASLSAAVMRNWLREELGFGGIIISDDFTMAAAGGMKSEEAAIRSIAAGADMVLVWPPDLRRTQSAFISALEDGRLSRERLREAAQRIIYEKIRMSLIGSDE
ncbi:MAG: glycoside hydrolase family 3 protein [Treponema sp.]|nr:glycoside hydrolase family 3 protein [Treponema sp.]